MEWVELGSLGQMQTGGTPSSKRKEYFVDGSIPWVSTVALNGGHMGMEDATKCITELAVADSPTKVVPAASLMVGIRVGVGKTGINDIPMCTNQDIASIVGIDETVWDKDYIQLAIGSKAALLSGRAQGATIKGISSRELKKLQIPKRSLHAQREIAEQFNEILRTASFLDDCKLRLNDLVKSRFIEMFGDPIANQKSLPQFKVEELAQRNKNAMKAGPFGSALKKEFYVKSGYKVYGQEQVISGDQSFGDYYIDEERYQRLESCRVASRDVLISLVGTVGKVLILDDDCEAGIINPRLVKISFNEQLMLPEYFEVVFSLESTKAKLLDESHGQTMNVLNLSMIKKLRLPVPDIQLQREFVGFVAQVDKLKAQTQQSIDKLQMLYDSLAQEYFGGDCA